MRYMRYIWINKLSIGDYMKYTKILLTLSILISFSQISFAQVDVQEPNTVQQTEVKSYSRDSSKVGLEKFEKQLKAYLANTHVKLGDNTIKSDVLIKMEVYRPVELHLVESERFNKEIKSFLKKMLEAKKEEKTLSCDQSSLINDFDIAFSQLKKHFEDSKNVEWEDAQNHAYLRSTC